MNNIQKKAINFAFTIMLKLICYQIGSFKLKYRIKPMMPIYENWYQKLEQVT